MNEATRWRRELAFEIGRAYSASDKVAAAILAGSVSRGWADEHSDIEIDLFYDQPPTDEERRVIIERAGGQVDLDWSSQPSPADYRAALYQTGGHMSQIWPYENDEWSEHYYVSGVNIGISGFLVTTIERYLQETLEQHDPDENKQMRLAAIQHGVPLVGDEQIRRWQSRVATYPEGLARAVVASSLEVDDGWWDATMLAERDDLLYWHGLLHRTAEKVIRILLGLNRIYLPDVRFKWLDRTIAAMKITPEYFAARFRRLFVLEPLAAAEEMQAIQDEVFDLVGQYMPGLADEVAHARRWSSQRRVVNHRRPTGERPA
jgi:hypothetical protein